MLRQILHSVVAVLLWVVFVYYWAIVIRRPMNPDTKTALISLSVLTLLGALYLIFWVFHNIRVFRKFSQRRKRRRRPSEPNQDYLGRMVVFESQDALRRSHHIEVSIARRQVGETVIERKLFWPVK